jgi:hypothetical protein
MTNIQSARIAELMKQGLCFIDDDPINSIVTQMDYNSQDHFFLFRQMDTVVGYLIADVKHNEESFRKFLEDNYVYEEFLLNAYYPPGTPARGHCDSMPGNLKP